MARKALATGTQLLAERTMGTVMPSGEDAVVSVVFDIQDPAGGFSMILAVAVEESPATPANIIYLNLLTQAPIAAGTPITAAGVYAVYAPGCKVYAVTSAGTAIAQVQRVYGRVF
jgi:hypothetical protein